jgi:hypothetical protein
MGEDTMAKAAARAIRDFPVLGDPWPAVEGWAARQGFKVTAQDGDHRLYSKGTGLMVAQRKVEMRVENGQMHLEAWVFSNGFARALSLFILPKEITVEPGGAKAIVPRKMGKSELNDLLVALGQPAIP